MREIKFRAWDKFAKEMIANVPTYYPWSSPGLVPMQFIGLKDKNGQEIYEGDILKVDPHDLPFQVEYRSDLSSFQLHEPTTNRWETMTPNVGFRYTVIGNIYKDGN